MMNTYTVYMNLSNYGQAEEKICQTKDFNRGTGLLRLLLSHVQLRL